MPRPQSSGIKTRTSSSARCWLVTETLTTNESQHTVLHFLGWVQYHFGSLESTCRLIMSFREHWHWIRHGVEDTAFVFLNEFGYGWLVDEWLSVCCSTAHDAHGRRYFLCTHKRASAESSCIIAFESMGIIQMHTRLLSFRITRWARSFWIGKNSPSLDE